MDDWTEFLTEDLRDISESSSLCTNNSIKNDDFFSTTTQAEQEEFFLWKTFIFDQQKQQEYLNEQSQQGLAGIYMEQESIDGQHDWGCAFDKRLFHLNTSPSRTIPPLNPYAYAETLDYIPDLIPQLPSSPISTSIKKDFVAAVEEVERRKSQRKKRNRNKSFSSFPYHLKMELCDSNVEGPKSSFF